MDDTNYMMLGHGFCGYSSQCPGDGIFFDYADGSQGLDNENFADPVSETGPIYLRLTVKGNIYTGYYSTDGVNWWVVGRKSGKNGFTPTKIGLRTFNLNLESPPEINADFHNFAVSTNYQKLFLPEIIK
jgi:hypothetical protein